MDEHNLQKLCKIAKDCYQLEFSAKPFKKNVVMVMGDQSSGKSSLVNYLFGDINVRETGSQAIDTQFTILETVSERTFIKYVGNIKYTKLITEHAKEIREEGYRWLKAPLQRESDTRRDIIWTELNQKEKKKRFSQLYGGNMGQILTQYDELVKAIVINERFVKGTELEQIRIEQERKKKKESEMLQQRFCTDLNSDIQMDGSVIIEKSINLADHIVEDYVVVPKVESRGNDLSDPLCMDLIIIDTPGFNDQIITDMMKFRANVEVLEYFYKQSSLALFLASPTNLLSISDALKMVQLTMLDSDTRNTILNQMVPTIMQQEQQQQQQQDDLKEKEVEGLMKTIAIGALKTLIPWGTLVDHVWSSRKIITNSVTKMVNNAFENKATEIQGAKYAQFSSSVYEKMYFVINKKDLCNNIQDAYFEFGYAVGRSFSHLPPLPSRNVLMIGCPHEQRKQRSNGRIVDQNIQLHELHIGDLYRLEAIINILRGEDHRQRCIQQHMNYIYEKMVEQHNKLSYMQRTLLYISDPLTQAKKLLSM
jgi:GTPase SAR1 family protein